MAAQRPNNGSPSASKESGDESFENLLSKLEEIVSQLEAGERPLEESLTLYEQGVATLKRCHVILDGADKRIRRLLQNSGGDPIVEDITQSAAGRGRHRQLALRTPGRTTKPRKSRRKKSKILASRMLTRSPPAHRIPHLF